MITYCRVDDRVVHGQTITTLIRRNPCNGILIVDDGIAENEMLKKIYKNVVPPDIKVLAFTAEKALVKLPEAERSEKNYFVIFKNVRTVGKLLDAGYKMPPVIEVGPTSSKAGGENIMRGLYLERDEMEIYSRLTDLGVEVGMQPIFTHPKEYWTDLRKKYGL